MPLPDHRPQMTKPQLPRATLITAAAALLTLAWAPCFAQTQSQGEFESCLTRLQPAAQRNGVRAESFSRFTQGVQADFGILDKLNYQPEFRLPIWDYLAALVDAERVADGEAGLARYADVLQRIQATYGVDPATVVAVWGVESNYGRITGKYPAGPGARHAVVLRSSAELFPGRVFCCPAHSPARRYRAGPA